MSRAFWLKFASHTRDKLDLLLEAWSQATTLPPSREDTISALNCLVNFPESHIVRDQFTVSAVAKFMKKSGSENTRHVLSVMKKYKPHLHSLHSSQVSAATHLTPSSPGVYAGLLLLCLARV